MTTVRPAATPPIPVQTPAAGAGRAAARAFFQAALDKTLPPQAPQAAAAPAPVQAQARVAAAPQAQAPAEPATGDAPRRIPRPGSLLDIRV